jgi:hypothetical protein
MIALVTSHRLNAAVGAAIGVPSAAIVRAVERLAWTLRRRPAIGLAVIAANRAPLPALCLDRKHHAVRSTMQRDARAGSHRNHSSHRMKRQRTAGSRDGDAARQFVK